MKKNIYLIFFLLFALHPSSGNAQETDTLKTLKISAEGYFYFIPNDFLFLPILKADKDKLHFEARYNYENTNTFSGWAGYNISGGNKVEYTITPMIGGVAGNTTGVAPGLEATISLKKFEFYTEAEYLFDFDSSDDNYFYNWADLTYSAKEWLWFGLSGQRIRSYQSDLDFQRGIIIGAGIKNWEINGYLFNIDTDSPFYVAALSYSF
jgi:hypothetical protein